MSAPNYPGIPVQQGYIPPPAGFPIHPAVPVYPPPPPGVIGGPQQMNSAIIAKGPSAPTASVSYSSQVVPGLIDTLMMPATVNLPSQENEPKPMVHVVYVGGFYPKTSSDFIINLMQKCGKLINFKRHTDPSSGLLATFALCEFESPRGLYYAMNCLSGLKFGDGAIKVNCNDKVRGYVEAWVSEQLSSLKEEHPQKSEEEIRELFKSPESALRQEFEYLIKYEIMEMQESNSKTLVSSVSAPKVDNTKQNQGKTDPTKPEASIQSKSNEAPSDLQLYASKEYTVHPKEVARRNKYKTRQRAYEEHFRMAERDWLAEEESLMRKLSRVGTVKRSTRERLVNEDLKGFPRFTSFKERQHEIELDLLDEREEAQEVASSETRCTIPLATQVTQPATVEPVKRELPTVFGSNVDEEEPMFKRTHRPLIKLGISDEEVWAQVPNTEEEAFAFQLDWAHLLSDQSLMKFISPWMKKCVMEFMGDDEAVAGEVVDFLSARLLERPNPTDLLAEVEQFLDEDSRSFVYEMWRRIIFHQLKTKGLLS